MASLLTGKCLICTVQTENDLSVCIWATQCGSCTQGFPLLSQFTLAWHTDRQMRNPGSVAFALQSRGLLQTERLFALFACGPESIQPPCDPQMGGSYETPKSWPLGTHLGQGKPWAERLRVWYNLDFYSKFGKSCQLENTLPFIFSDDQSDIGKEKQFSFS